MRTTVLTVVQSILSSMDSDEVNSLNDTIEAQQVASIIESCYNDIITTIDLPDQSTFLQLDASLDSALPTVMYLPQAFDTLEWLRYNKRGSGTSVSSSQTWTSPDDITIHFGTDEATWSSGSSTGDDNEQFTPLKFLTREEFLRHTMSFDSNDTNVLTYYLRVGGVDITLLCQTDKPPDYYTVVEGRTILFDSYDSSLDLTLQTSKTLGYGRKGTYIVVDDTTVIDLDSKYYTILYNEAKALAFSELKQMENPHALKKARRGWIKSQKVKNAVPYGDPAINTLPTYGRRIR